MTQSQLPANFYINFHPYCRNSAFELTLTAYLSPFSLQAPISFHPKVLVHVAKSNFLLGILILNQSSIHHVCCIYLSYILIYRLFITYFTRYYNPDTTLIGFPSINFFILSAKIETSRCLVSRPFHPI